MNVSLRNIGANALSILSSDAMNRATSFVIYAMVARHLGAFQFGQLALAMTFFQLFAFAGLKTLIVREVAKDRSQTRKYFVNSCTIISLISLVSLGVLLGLIRLMHYSPKTNLIIVLLLLGLFPFSISTVCEGIFQAWERMHYIAFVNVPANLAKMAGAYLLLARNRDLYTVILVLLVSFFVIAAAEVWLVLRRFPSQRARVSIPFALALVRSGLTFLAIDKVISVEAGLNVILISKLASETVVGLYSAAVQLLVPLALVYQSVAQSIFPVMCRQLQPGLKSLKRIAEQAIEALLILALPTAAGLFFLGHWLLSVLYKNPAFQQAVPALRIVAWTVILQVFSHVLGQVLFACHREQINLKIVAVGMVLNFVVGWPLISFFGLRGAAVTLFVNRLVGCILHWIPVSRMFSGMSLAKIIWKPVIAAACMAAFLAVSSNLAEILRGVSATLIYSAALVGLAIAASGGPQEFKKKFLPLLSG